MPIAVTERHHQPEPAAALPLRQLLNLSIYWFGLTALWGAINGVIIPVRLDRGLVPAAEVGLALALVTTLGALVPIIVQPTAGVISDFTTSRWGRRKPFILVGAVLDVGFLVGLAAADGLLALIAFVLLLQFSSNLAQGPFQGYVPDLVPRSQVGLASGLMGVMIILGRVGGTALATVGVITGDFFWPTVALGVIELATALVLIVTVDEGRLAPSREGRGWFTIARSAWGLDILRERSYLWLVASRLCFLAGVAMIDLAAIYLRRSHGLAPGEQALWINVSLLVVGLATVVTVVPAARLSDRLGRKRLIYAACLTAAVGMAGVALAPTVQSAVLALVPVGIGAGAFLAVDWALMTDIVPKATTGRYMGISNVATASAAPVALTIGGLLLDRVGPVDGGEGPRAAFVASVVLFGIAALLLRPVDQSRREA